MKYTAASLDPDLHPVSESMCQVLAEADIRIIEKKCSTEQQAINFARDADAIIAAQAPVNSNVIAKLTKCKVIARPGAGTDNVDSEAATKKGIVVVYVPDFCADEVSNHTLMFILACNKKLLKLDKAIRSGYWGFRLVAPLPSVKGQILGLVGFGRIARNLAGKVRPLGLKVFAYDPYVQPEVFEEHNVKQVSLEEILKQSDYVSLHTPLTEETKNLIGTRQLAMMKPTACLINCARGAVVDEEALFDALEQDIIAGAALDCLATEPPQKNNPLFELDNVIFTPHSAAYSDEAIKYLREKSCIQIADVLTGRKPEFIRNPEVLDKVKLS